MARPPTAPCADIAESLRQVAAAARAAGRWAEAVEAGRALMRLDSADWQATLDFARDIRMAGRYPDGEPEFRRAARNLPDREWVAHYGALYAFHADDLPFLRERAERLSARALAGAVAWQQRDYAAAEAHFAGLNPGREAASRRYRRLAAVPGASTGRYGVAAINLDRNAERWALLQREVTTGPLMHRVPGVLGSPLPGVAARRLRAPGSGRGTLGCFLSHAAAWEWVLAEGLPHALVIEDDVQPTVDLPAGLDGLGLSPGCELCFVNDQMDHAPPADGFRTVPLAEVMRQFPPGENAAGANGYVVSAAGARRLLGWVEVDGFEGDVDWRIIQYGLSPEDAASIDPAGEAAAALGRLAPLARADRLNVQVLSPALIRTVAITSDREDENRAP